MNKNLNELTFTDLIEFLKSVDKKTWQKAAGFAVAAALFSFFILWPAWFERIIIRQKMKDLAGQHALYETLKIQKPELERRKESYQQFIYGVKDRIFNLGDASLLLGQISKLADESSVSIVASRPEDFEGKFPAPFNTQYEASQYDFTVEGNYHNLGEFVSKIESYPKILKVLLFHVRPSGDEEVVYLTDLSLSAVSFKNQQK